MTNSFQPSAVLGLQTPSLSHLPASTLLVLCVLLLPALAAAQKDCSKSSTGLIPLSEMLPGEAYFGQDGGLYGGNSNLRPSQHEMTGLFLSRQVVPLDTQGRIDDNGKIVLLSVGMSNAFEEFGQFMDDAALLRDLAPRLELFNGAKGGTPIEDMRSPSNPYWDSLDSRLLTAGLNPLQVQVVWLKQAYTAPPSDFHTLRTRMAGDLGRIVRILKQRFPNLQLTYLSTRIYGHYSSNPNREEPSAYDAAYAARTLIQQQINGHPAVNFDPRRGPVNAPWLAWGPYLWNDGLNPRSDGLVWECADFEDDGHHPAESADRKVSDMLMEFFRTDATTQGWFLAD